MITKTLQEEFFDELLPVIREELPRVDEPREFAHGLVAAALAHNISAQEAKQWLRMRLAGKQFTLANFTRWAQALEELKCELDAQRPAKANAPGPCGDCGGALQTLAGRLYCASCGEERQ